MGKKSLRVAVAGATGAVGREMLKVLEQRDFPVSEVVALATAKSVGIRLPFKGGELSVRDLTEDSFKGLDLALFSAGGSTSERFAPIAAKSGCVVVDNSSAWRMNEKVPLVVPEVNPDDLSWHPGIIANPNCSTIQMVMALKPIHDAAVIRRVVVSTYQSTSGAGKEAIDELVNQTKSFFVNQTLEPRKFTKSIAFNVIPHIDVFLDDGSTKEEWKMVV